MQLVGHEVHRIPVKNAILVEENSPEAVIDYELLVLTSFCFHTATVTRVERISHLPSRSAALCLYLVFHSEPLSCVLF